MKIRIKTYNGELPSYLTVGKVYEVLDSFDDRVFVIKDDRGNVLCVGYNKCPHLNGGSWEIVE